MQETVKNSPANTSASPVRRRAVRNRLQAAHKFPVGAYVICKIGVRSEKTSFRITGLMPDGGAGFQYRIKGERDGIERVVAESSLEAAV